MLGIKFRDFSRNNVLSFRNVNLFEDLLTFHM